MPDTPNAIIIYNVATFADCVQKCDAQKISVVNTPGCQWVTYVSEYDGPGHGRVICPISP